MTKERPLVQPLVQPRGIQGDASLAQRRALGVLEDSNALRSAGVTHVCAKTYAAQPLILYTEALIKCIPQVLPPFSPRNIAPVNSAQNGCNRVPGKISWQCPAAWFQVEQGYTCGPLRGARSAQERYTTSILKPLVNVYHRKRPHTAPGMIEHSTSQQCSERA